MKCPSRPYRTPSKTEAYDMGFQCKRAHVARTGRYNVSPSIAQREEWGHNYSEFLAGWNAANRDSLN